MSQRLRINNLLTLTVILVFGLIFSKAFSQSTSDCNGAIPVCQGTYTQTSSPTGFGVQEVFNTCLQVQERRTVWYIFTVQSSGTFGFNINTLNDYDWALYNITNGGCSGVPNSTPVRCNYSGTFGNTGMNAGSSNSTVPQSNGAGDSPISNGLNVTVGQTFALVVDNFTQDQNGYTLSFSGTASFIDNSPPTITGNSINCNTNQVTITFSEPVACSSIAGNGSDFQISGGATITSATGIGCSGPNGNTTQIRLNFTAPSSGQYTISTKVGSDGNTINDICGNSTAINQSFTVSYLANITAVASPYAICQNQSSTLTATGGPASGATYTWSPATSLSSSNTITTVATPNATTIYTAQVSYGSCVKSDTARVVINNAPFVSVSPLNPSICPGDQVNLTATSTINGSNCGSCTYTWNNGAATGATWNNRPAGTYTVVATNPLNGCSSSSAQTIVTEGTASAGATCNVYFVTTNGSGTGLAATSPTTIQNALNLANCSQSVIKMAVGTYNISTPLTITSNLTIEGGYSADFATKTSTAGATTINRTAVNVEGLPDAGRLVALQATGATNFRLQDLTIRTDNGSSVIASNLNGISTYGVYLNACSNYNIVRCQILPGNASSGVNGIPGTDGNNGGGGDFGTRGNSSIFVLCESDPAGIGGNGGTAGSGGANAFGGNASSGTNGGMGGNGSNDDNCSDGNDGQPGVGPLGGVGGEKGYRDGSGGPDLNGNGKAGGDGTNGANGSNGGTVAANYNLGFYNPSYGLNGTPGNGGGGGGGGGGAGCDDDDCDGSGGGGSGGSGGGGGGGAGSGGYGGGSSYGVFIYNGGTGGVIDDCNVTPGAFGTGGLGGNGGVGGLGAPAVPTACCDPCSNGDDDCNRGGPGGKGGDGGAGGKGGDATDGEAVAVKLVGISSPLTLNQINFNLAAQPTITVANLSCTNTNINHSAGASAAWTFGAGSSPSSGNASSINTQYSTIGRKDVTYSTHTYTGFNNILTTAFTGTLAINTASQTVCPGTYAFTASNFPTAGVSYVWAVSSPSGGSSVISNSSVGNPTISFTNSGATPLVYNVSLTVTSQCCGQLGVVTLPITVLGTPTVTGPGNQTVCPGANAVFTVNVSGGTPTYSWAESADGGGSFNTLTNATPYSGTSTNSLTVSGVTSSMAGNIYRVGINHACGTIFAQGTLNISTLPTATVTASAANVCANPTGSVNLTFNFTGTGPWTVNYNTVTASGSTPNTFTTSNNPHTINGVSVTQDVSFVITSVTAQGCTNNTLSSTAVNAVTSVPNIVGPLAPILTCANSVNITNVVTVPPSVIDGPLTYFQSNGTTPVSNPLAITTSGTYIIRNTNICGTDQESIQVTLSPPPTLTLLPNAQTVCAGTSLTFTATASPTGGTYVWSPVTNSTSTLAATVNATTTYSVSYTFGDCATQSASTTITVREIPSVTMTASTAAVCQGGTANILFTNNGSATVIVSYTINGTPNSVSVNGNSTATVPVVTTAPNTFTYAITSIAYSNAPTCSQTSTQTVQVQVTGAPTATFAVNTTTACQNGTSPVITFTNPQNVPIIVNYTLNGTPQTAVSVAASSTATVNVPTGTVTTLIYQLTSVTLNNGSGCNNTLNQQLSVNITSNPTILVSGTTTVCQGQPAQTITVQNPNNAAVTVTYTVNGGAPQTVNIAAGGNTSFTVTTGTAATTTYNFTNVAISGGCSSVINETASVTVIAAPTVTISGTTTVCQNATSPNITITNNNSSNVSVVYDLNGSQSTVTVNANSSVTIPANTSSQGTLTYTLVSVSLAGGGCTNNNPSGSATVTVTTLPTASITGGGNVCQNGTPLNITINNPQSYNIDVTYTVNGTPTTATFTPGNTNISVPTGTAGTFTYTLTNVSNAGGGCPNTATGTASVTVRPTPTVTLTGGTAVCQGGNNPTLTLTNPQNAQITVTYTLNGGAPQNTSVPANGTATISGPGTATAGTFNYVITSVAYSSGSACTNTSVSQSAQIVVNASPSATISGTTSVCQNASASFFVTNPMPSEVQVTYTINNGTPQTANIPASTTNHPISFNTSATGTFTISLTNVAYTTGSPCGVGISGQTAVITVLPAPTATVSISGNSTVCQNTGNVIVNFNNPNAQQIQVSYTLNGTAQTPIIIDANDGESITLSTSSAGSFVVAITSVAYTSGGGCANNLSQSVTLTVQAGPTLSGTLTASICTGNSPNFDLTATAPAGTTFTWIAPNVTTVNGETQTLQTTTTINDLLSLVNATGSASSVGYQVTPTSSGGCVGTIGTVTINVLPLPSAPIIGTITQPTCATPTGTVAISGLPTPGTWTLNGSPSGSWSNSGATFNATGLTPNTTYTFTVTNAGGCSSVASTNAVINAAPTTIATPTVSGAPEVCAGSSTNFTISGEAGTVVAFTVSNGTSNVSSPVTLNSSGQAILTISGATANVVVTLTSATSGACGGAINVSATTTYNNACNSFGECNLVVAVIGDGSGALGTAAVPFSIREVNTSLGTVADYTSQFTGSNLLTAPGTTSNFGFISSHNGFLAVGGYNVAAGTAGVQSNNNKVVNIIDGNTNVVSRTTWPTTGTIPFSGQNISSVIPTSSNTFYTSGNGSGTPNTGGIWYYDGSSFSQIWVTPTNIRNVEIFNDGLFFSTQNAPLGVNQFSPILPTTNTGTSSTVLLGATNVSNIASWSPSVYGFSLSPTGCELYISEILTGSQRGISKFTRNSSGIWSFAYRFQTYGYGVVVDYSGSQNIIYATVNPSSTPIYPTQIVKLLDNGSSLTISGSAVSAATNTRFSGIDFTPNSFKPITISTQPVATLNACAGSNPTISVTATSTVGLTYQWYENNSNTYCGAIPLTGQTNATLTIPHTSGTRFYFCKIIASCASVKMSAISAVTIVAPPTATLTYGTYCVSSTTTVNPTLGAGSFTGPTVSYSISPANAGFNASNGSFTPQGLGVGDYVVTYTMNNGACPVATTTAVISVINQPVVSSISYSAPFCQSTAGSQPVTLVGNSGGTYTATPATGLTLNSLSGAITPSSSTPGTYTVTYTIPAGNGCTAASANVQVTITPTPQGTFSYSPSTYCVSNTSTINPNINNLTSGGTYSASPSGLSLNTSNGSFVPNTSTPNTYTVTYTLAAAGGCPAYSTTANVTVYALPNVTANVSAGSACAGSTVSLTGSPSGMNTYTWSGPAGSSIATPSQQNSAVTLGSTSGTFTLVATDANGCSNSAQASITVNPSPVATAGASVTAVCANGSFNLTASGGTSYVWSGPAGATFSTSNTVQNPMVTVATTGGNFTVTVTSGSGCSSTASVNVQVNENPVATASFTGSAACAGSTITLSGGVSGMSSYTWSGPAGATFSPNANVQNPTVTLGTTGGPFSLTIVDANGCQATASTANLTVNPLPVAGASLSAPAVCQGGSISLSATPNSMASYTWAGPSGSNFSPNNTSQNPTVTVSTSGTFTVTVVDGNGCRSTATTAALTVNPGPSVTATVSTVTACANGTINLTGSPSGMTSYLWTGPSGSNIATPNQQNSAVTLGTTGGTFTLAVVDGNGCSGTAQTAVVNVNALPNVTASFTGSAACAGSSMQLFGNPSGMTSYAWSGPAGVTFAPNNTVQNPTVTLGTTSGTFTLTATNAQGCSASASTANLTVNPLPVAGASLSAPAVCTGGTITLTASPNGMNTYTWSGPSGTNFTPNNTNQNPSVTVTNGGTFTVTVVNGNGCSATATTAALTVNPGPTVTATLSAAAVCQNGTLTLTGSPAGMTSYTWTGPSGANIATPSSQNSSVTVTATGGVFTLNVVDGNGCTGSAQTESLGINPPPAVSASFTGSGVCEGGTTNLLGNPSGMASYAWVGPSGAVFTPGNNVQSPSVTLGTTSGTFTLTVTDNNGCSNSASTAILPVNSPPVATATASVTAVCSNGSFGLTAGPNGMSSYTWSGPVGATFSASTNTQNPTVTVSTAGGVYSLTVVSSAGCVGTTTVNIPVNPNPTVSVNTSSICLGDQATVTATPNPAGTYSYTWTVPNPFPNPGNVNSFQTTIAGTYSVIATDGNGCFSPSGTGTVTYFQQGGILQITSP